MACETFSKRKLEEAINMAFPISLCLLEDDLYISLHIPYTLLPPRARMSDRENAYHCQGSAAASNC